MMRSICALALAAAVVGRRDRRPGPLRNPPQCRTLARAAENDASFRARRDRGGRVRAAGQRAGRARTSSSRRRASWTRSSCARSGAATTRCCRISRASRRRRRRPGRRGQPQRDCTTSSSTRDRGIGWTTTGPSCPARRPSPKRRTSIPTGATKPEVQKWIDSLSGDEKAAATGFFTTIRRSDEHFVVVPYSIEYQGALGRAADLLREAAQLTADARAEGVPDRARRRLPQQRLLRQRRRLDGARRRHRADDRPVRGLRGRVVQLQSGLRGLHHRP